MIENFFNLNEYAIAGSTLWILAIVTMYSNKTPKNMLIFAGIYITAISSILVADNHYGANMGLIIGMIFFLLGKLKYSYRNRLF